MKKLLLIHGINLNLLGMRNKQHYGTLTLKDIEKITAEEAERYGFNVMAYQSNQEGCLVDVLQMQAMHCQGIIINPGAWTHYSYGLYDALMDAGLPTIEVHLSHIDEREDWRQKSVIAPACIKVIKGKKEQGYREAVQALAEYLHI